MLRTKTLLSERKCAGRHESSRGVREGVGAGERIRRCRPRWLNRMRGPTDDQAVTGQSRSPLGPETFFFFFFS